MFPPATIAPFTLESFELEHRARGPWIYRLLLGGVAIALGLLPLIAIDVSVRAPGVVRPITERIELRAAVSGRVLRMPVRENAQVVAGDEILAIDALDLGERLRRNAERQLEAGEMCDDARELVRAVSPAGVDDLPSTPTLVTATAGQEFAQYLAQAKADALAVARAAATSARFDTLAARGLASQQDRENAQYDWERLQAEATAHAEQALGRWRTQEQEAEKSLAELRSEQIRLEQERGLATVRAPASGTLVEFSGWAPGATVMAGQSLGYISPAEALVVETRVTPADIGLIRVGQRVRLQVDAFPYTYWGTLVGEVVAIAGDWTAMPDRVGALPAFKVLVRPERCRWFAPTGAAAELRKGLTLSARFIVARRTLWQLLRDEARGWLDPVATRPNSP